MKNIIGFAVVIEAGTAIFTPASAAQGEGAALVLAGLGLLGLFVLLYFLPTIIGCSRGVNASVSLFFVNLFAGWTVLGWIVCLIWAVTGATRAQDAFYKTAGIPINPPAIPTAAEIAYHEAYAKERARLDHEAAKKS